ncbi:release factor glutamine methyltransferase [Leuconostocaceae bacterium R-53105]|uniref:peptide chain release factor N(5)-glutamine methyltransferase n=2 Tax=Convivina intestini TaxID=1505726 RepID=A0A2U1DBI6_9LACO|nr:peptide chain release factor N(5)-glutamine methyltransferase [Convivina intestini]PVY85028.1 release factor glutamine methyltransferase [Convivina intestini]CAH1853448.1 Release factor glutamine methyltransferase [Convivina intestini]SDB89252.1 release factor glutamine methyltransferase [Leuconostocaceae bacterium R-53105]
MMINNNAGKSQPVKISILEARKWALTELTAAGLDESESADNIDFLLTGALGINYGMLRANITRMLPENISQVWPQWIAGLINRRPPQYLLGLAPFYGHEFMVDERVLIPRPETEQLVEWILKDLKPGMDTLKVLDIGTGSGAIIETLLLADARLQGMALDISEAALNVAQRNAQRLNVAHISFIQSDVWQNLDQQAQFDIIVSNPPYIDVNQQAKMDQSVKDYEPDLALYANNQGLAIYQTIAQDLGQHLTANGRAYFEIGYDQGPTLVELFQAAVPDAEVTLKQDFSGLDRMIRVKRHGN